MLLTLSELLVLILIISNMCSVIINDYCFVYIKTLYNSSVDCAATSMREVKPLCGTVLLTRCNSIINFSFLFFFLVGNVI